MDKLKFAEGLVKKIIEDRHNFFNTETSEDLEHITNIKRMIKSVSDYLKYEGLSEKDVNDLAGELRQFTRSKYVEMCIANKFEGEDDEAVCQESEVLFDYIYENEEYPDWKSAWKKPEVDFKTIFSARVCLTYEWGFCQSCQQAADFLCAS